MNSGSKYEHDKIRYSEIKKQLELEFDIKWETFTGFLHSFSIND